jgi:N-acetylglucosamine-6-phosphate deacetylase
MNALAKTVLAAPRLLAPGGQWTGPGAVEIEDGRITRIRDVADAATLPGGVLTPGLLDLHNNGAFGVDFATADPAGWRSALGRLAARGVTAVQPTIITAPLPAILAQMDGIDAAATAAAMTLADQPVARILGAHLEGPFLSPARRGAHRADWLQDPAPAALDTLLGHPATRRMLRTITLAPERPHGLAAIRRLTEAGVIVSLGHSDATAEQALAGTGAGATLVTHLFNAMRPLGHRDPALPGVALTDPRLWCCLITDGQHVDPIACRLVFAATPGRVVAVTDSILIAGLPPGTEMEFGGLPVMVDPTGLGRRLDGTISGAGIVLDEGVRCMIAAGIDPALALHAATEAPATAIGRPDLGRIAPGARADLVWWDDDWIPRRVWIGGMEVTHDY